MSSKGREIATVEHGSPAAQQRALAEVVTNRKLPARVTNAIKDLVMSYKTGPAESDADYAVVVGVYMDVAEEFHPLFAEKAAKALIKKNSSNPFRPTPEDFHEAMKRVYQAYKYKLGSFLTHERGGCETLRDLPGDVARSMIRDMILYGSLSYWGEREPIAFQMKDEVLARWPVDILNELGIHDAILEMRAARRAYLSDAESNELRLRWRAAEDRLKKARSATRPRQTGFAQDWATDVLVSIGTKS